MTSYSLLTHAPLVVVQIIRQNNYSALKVGRAAPRALVSISRHYFFLFPKVEFPSTWESHPDIFPTTSLPPHKVVVFFRPCLPGQDRLGQGCTGVHLLWIYNTGTGEVNNNDASLFLIDSSLPACLPPLPAALWAACYRARIQGRLGSTPEQSQGRPAAATGRLNE